MDTFFKSNPGMSSRIAHHIDFPDYSEHELLTIAEKMVSQMHYALTADAILALRDYISLRKTQPHFANARSIRNALDRARLRQANRIFELASQPGHEATREELSELSAADIRASRVFQGGL